MRPTSAGCHGVDSPRELAYTELVGSGTCGLAKGALSPPCSIHARKGAAFTIGLGHVQSPRLSAERGPLHFPAGTDFGAVSEADLDAVADEINDRPRKRLALANPTERLAELMLQ